MDKENNSKIEKIEKDIKKLKKRQPRKMTAMKFVGVALIQRNTKLARQKLTKHYLMDLKSYVTLKQVVEL